MRAILIILGILLLAVGAKFYLLNEGEFFSNKALGDLYSTDMTEVDLASPSLYNNMNAQQAIYMELVKLFRWFSGAGKRKVEGVYELYKPETLEIEVTDELNQVTDAVLALVRKNSQFKFVRNRYNTYDNVKQFQSPSGDVQYIYEVFVQDPVNAFELKLEVDVVKYVSEEAYRERLEKRRRAIEGACADTVWPTFPTFPGGYPQPRQEIPLPTQVIPTGNQVIGLKGINVEPILPIRSLHINGIRIANSTLVLGATDDCMIETFQGMGGYSDGTIESSNCVGGWKNGCQAPSKERNPWIPVPGEDRFNHYDKDCSLALFTWDSKGIPPTPATPCVGIRDPSIQQPFTAEYNPSVATIPRGQGDNAWLFELSRGQPPHS